ncbi:hypothetical protein BJV77DRAFT_1074934, partial [Russula vinacea]
MSSRVTGGVTLIEAYPDEFPPPVPAPVVAAPLPVPPVVIAQPVALPSAPVAPTLTRSLGASSSFRGPTPVLVPPARISPRSPAASSPAQTPSPVVPPVSSCSPSVGSRTVRACRVAPAASAAPDTAKSARCERCRQMKKGCSLVAGASGPCTLCVKAGAECVPIGTAMAARAALPPAARPVARSVVFRKLPSRNPAVPVHGSPDVPLRVLHDWRAELVAAQADYLLANSALTVASATKEAADAGVKAARARADAAAGDVKVAVARLNEADKRQKLAWSHYLELSALEGEGKGKARASSHASEGEDEIVGEELGSGAEDDDAMWSSRPHALF